MHYPPTPPPRFVYDWYSRTTTVATVILITNLESGWLTEEYVIY